MSFSSEVKQELSGIENTPCCAKAESYGLLLFGRAFCTAEVSILTDHECVAISYQQAIKLLCDTEPEIICSSSGKYTVSVTNKKLCMKILNSFGYSGKETSFRINHALFEDECCRSAFIRGAFLACGTVTSPEKEYHLEFPVMQRNLANDFIKVFDEFEEIAPKLGKRNSASIVYFKDSSSIEDVLTVMGASASSLQIMGVKVLKDIRNNVNRKMNFDSANINRSVTAGCKQAHAIEKIIKRSGFDSIPEELREIAQLRLDNPDMSLSELTEELSSPITKAALSYRLRKIIELANSL